MTDTKSVWVDTDLGVDDLLAIEALRADRQIAGLSLSFGCAPLPRAVENAFGAAEALGWRFAITQGAARPILGEIETAERILGPRGLPTRGATIPARGGHPLPAIPALADWVEQCGVPQGGAQSLTKENLAQEILALGPLTNLAALVLARPDLTLPQVTWMGGSLGAGNHSPHAEFNALADPLALAILLERGVRIRMIDLEACRKVQITEADVARVKASNHPQSAVLGDLLGGYLDIGLSRGRNSMALYDPVASAALARPDLFTFAACALQVDLTGDVRGRTRPLPDALNPASEIVTDLNATAIREWCLSSLVCPKETL
jgi:purine nucleosidase